MLPLKMSPCLVNTVHGRDSSLNLLVLIFGSGAVSQSQVYVAFNVLDLSIVDMCRFSSSRIHRKTLIFTFIS